MNDCEFFQVDAATRHLPGDRRDGVNPMSTEETRAEVLEALGELGRAHPNWRLGQTLSNLAMAAGRLDAGCVWDLEDDSEGGGNAVSVSNTVPSGRRWTAAELRKLPPTQPDAIMEAAAVVAQEDYRNDPQLTAFEAFGKDDLYGDSSNTETR